MILISRELKLPLNCHCFWYFECYSYLFLRSPTTSHPSSFPKFIQLLVQKIHRFLPSRPTLKHLLLTSKAFGEVTNLKLWWTKFPEVLKLSATTTCFYPRMLRLLETTTKINQNLSCHPESTMNHLTFIHSHISPCSLHPPFLQVDHHNVGQETFQHDESCAQCRHGRFPQSLTGAFSNLGTTTELHAGLPSRFESLAIFLLIDWREGRAMAELVFMEILRFAMFI